MTLSQIAKQAVDETNVLRGPGESPNCGICPFAKDGKPARPVRGIGPADPDFLVIGEGPGANESAQGVPFVGASGQMVNRALMAVKVDRKRIWVGNATLCQPPPGSSDAKKQEARECCKPRLLAEIASLPKVPVLALGGVAAQGFLGDKFSISKLAGSVHDADLDGRGERPIIPTVHPAAILRGGAGAGGGAHAVDLLFWNLIYDVAKVKRLAAGEDVRFSDDVEIEAESGDRAHELVRDFAMHARRERLVAVDAETVGTHGLPATIPYWAKLTAIGLATPVRAISVAYDILQHGTRRLIASLLADSTIDVIAHNGLYDRPVFDRHNMPFGGRIDDSMILHHNAFPGLAHDLQRVTTQFFCINPWKAEFRSGRGTTAELLTYNARDALSTARLRGPLRNCVTASRSEKTYEVDMKMASIAKRMHMVGVPISREVNARMTKQFEAVLSTTLGNVYALVHDPNTYPAFLDRLALEQAKRIRKADPPDYSARHALRLDALKKKPPDFSISNSDHIAAYLRARGVSLYHQTEKGKTSTKRDVLEGLPNIPEVRDILEYREAAKMLSTFVAKLPPYMDANDRIHPVWSIHKITGRWGAEHPSVMNWSKGDKKKNRPNLRDQVVAPTGRVFVGADFAQLEARIIALLSGDRFLVDIFHNDKDIHSEFARIVWKDFDQRPVDERKKLRDMIKRPEYGALYGAAVQTMYNAVVTDYPNVKLADLARMAQLMTAKMAGVEAWHQQLIKDVAIKQEIRSFLYGRRRCFPLGNAEVSTVYNFPVQSSGADIMDTGLLNLIPRLPQSAEVILQIHDAIVVECDEDDAERVRDLVTESLSQEHTYNGITIKFPADAEIGKSWSEI